jgi:hypothetical protein
MPVRLPCASRSGIFEVRITRSMPRVLSNAISSTPISGLPDWIKACSSVKNFSAIA